MKASILQRRGWIEATFRIVSAPVLVPVGSVNVNGREVPAYLSSDASGKPCLIVDAGEVVTIEVGDGLKLD